MGNDKHLKLRAASTSGLGRVLAHLQQGPTNQQDLASITLQSRFLPFAMDKDEAGFRSVAIRCATECEAWAKAIREYAELGIIPNLPGVVKGQDDSITHDSIGEESVDGEFESDEEVEVDEVDDLGF
ncbi:hypothetical protein C7B62_23615 [Pleurocapsa sp. CCALA 161]|uniref:hypothetical protein n=1 Tax=Pleurocapsa sp. CCALA 161 TaxID=2107688 RepID=UPI000D05DEB2|nr:hypothetical protein [Pleurocapsa sp. CCALA 161]PSB06144.1 hypothetical protein C7B62_23615 [Pleurocapsa sp. CCALA 161]